MRAFLGLALAAVFALAPADAGVEPGGLGDSTAGAVLAGGDPACGTYRVCPGDTLFVSVDGEELFTRECQVNGSGTISYPMLGDVQAANFTCSDLTGRLSDGLRKYLRHPRVMVTVRRYGQVGMSVFVMGEVGSPGLYPLASGSGLMQALAAAGGLTDMASGEISILKPGIGTHDRIALSDDPGAGGATDDVQLAPGDVILVARKLEARYAVLGEVPTPGMFDMPVRGEVRVLDAMQDAGLLGSERGGDGVPPGHILDDPARIADLEHAFLTRGDLVIPIDLASLLGGDTSQNLALQPGDVLTVPRRPFITVYGLGEVRTPGRRHLPTDSRVLDLVNASGGTTATARTADGTVLRLVEGAPTSIPVDLEKLLSSADTTQNIALQEGDVLFVPSRRERDPNRLTLLSLLRVISFF
jgi:polysaccharide export outer membrane protein